MIPLIETYSPMKMVMCVRQGIHIARYRRQYWERMGCHCR